MSSGPPRWSTASLQSDLKHREQMLHDVQDMHIMYYALVAVFGDASAMRGTCRNGNNRRRVPSRICASNDRARNSQQRATFAADSCARKAAGHAAAGHTRAMRKGLT
jgi:hypothetical protein